MACPWKVVALSFSHRRDRPPGPLAAIAGVSLVCAVVAGAGLYSVADDPGADAALAASAPAVVDFSGGVGHVEAAARSTATPMRGKVPAVKPGCGAATMPLKAAVAQTLMIGVKRPSRGELRDLTDPARSIGGLFLHGDGRKVLTDGRLAIAGRATLPPLVAADDEGGRVQRIAFAYSMPSAREQADTMSPAQVRKLAETRGRALREYGITMDLAPVIDVSDQRDGAVIGDRAYANRPGAVTRYAREFAAGLRAAGVMPALKHFPGHGRASGDSHLGKATTPRDGSLRAVDWAPYRDLAGPGVAVMMGHLRVPGLSTKGLPASVDPRLYKVLREEIGFTGLVVTDELAGMQAISDKFGLRESVRRAIGAGADLALFNAEPDRVGPLVRKLVADVRAGRLAETRVREAAGRVLAAKGCTLKSD